MTRLLLDSQPLIVIPELASIAGLNESIVLQQIHYWTEINRKAGRNYRDGYYWTYNSYQDWQAQLPFWSVSTIKRVLNGLKNKTLIVMANYNQAKFDRTLWYRVDYQALSVLVSGIGEVKLTSSIGSKWTNAQPRGFADDGDANNLFELEKWKHGERANINDSQVFGN